MERELKTIRFTDINRSAESSTLLPVSAQDLERTTMSEASRFGMFSSEPYLSVAGSRSFVLSGTFIGIPSSGSVLFKVLGENKDEDTCMSLSKAGLSVT